MISKKNRKKPTLTNSDNFRIIPYRRAEPDLDKIVDAVIAVIEEMEVVTKEAAQVVSDPVWDVLPSVAVADARQQLNRQAEAAEPHASGEVNLNH